MSESLAKRFFHNAVFRIATALWIKLLGLFAVPIIIYTLGPDMHGVYVLLLSVFTHFKFIDLGFGAGLVKYSSEFRAVGDNESVRGIARTTMGMNLLAGLAGFAAIWCGSNGFLLKYFEKSPDLAADMPFLLKLVAVTFFVQMISAAPAASLQAAHRFDVNSIIEIVSKGVEIGGFIAILLLGGTLKHLMEYYLLLSVVIVASFLICAWKLVPDVSFLPKIYPKSFKLLLGFGVYVTVSRIAAALSSYVDKFILLAFISAASVSYYYAPFQLAMLISFIPSMVTSIILPTASELNARGDTERLKQLFVRGTKYIFVLTMPIVLFLILAPGQTIEFWISGEYADKGRRVLTLLTLSQTILSLAFFVPNMIIVGMGNVRSSTIFTVTNSALNFILCLVLVPKYGIMGAAWAQLASVAFTVPFFILHFIPRIKPKLTDFISERFPRAIAVNVFLGALLYFTRGMITNRPTLIAGLMLMGLMTVVFMWILNVASKNEKDIILSYFKKRVR